ncbi:MAG TPA: patatin-like phospholipase family protein [Polyangiaceae bacterium]|nr:patatin-like phospholipase family protein [Polyangiaceae bacterium]
MADGRAGLDGRRRGRALVLTGGGARGAYQVGALRALADLCDESALPFPIVSGVSAGAINAVYLASRADDFREAVDQLWSVWEHIRADDVFLTNPTSLLHIGFRLLVELSLGSLIHEHHSNHLLDTTPLRDLLAPRGCDSAAIRRNLGNGVLRALAVTATDYHSGNAVTFFDSDTPIEPWVRTTRLGVHAKIRPEHALASAALPIFFPPVNVDGRFFGDGCIRLRAPLSTAIHLGAERILAIGIRSSPPTGDDPGEGNGTDRVNASAPALTLAEIGGVLLNALLLDGLELDVERLERINRTIELIPASHRSAQPLRTVPLTVLRPSRDLGRLASELLHRVPLPVRHLLRGLGATDHVGWDLLSYLFFDRAYTSKLLDLGYEDTIAQRETVQRFLVA